MVLPATSYPFLNIFWTMLIFFAWVAWISVAVMVLLDIFRRHDLSGWGKAAWTVFVIVLPFLGVLVYLVAHRDAIGAERSGKAAAAAPFDDDYVRTTGGANGAAGEIAKGKQLLDTGVITQAEFDTIKAKAIA